MTLRRAPFSHPSFSSLPATHTRICQWFLVIFYRHHHPVEKLVMELALSLSPSLLEAPHLLPYNTHQIHLLGCYPFTWLGVVVLVAVTSPSLAARSRHTAANFVIRYFVLISGQL